MSDHKCTDESTGYRVSRYGPQPNELTCKVCGRIWSTFEYLITCGEGCDSRPVQAKVVELHPTTVNKEIVDTLKKMLEEAEKGELVGLAYVGAYKGRGTYSRGLYGAMLGQPLLFGLAQLQHRIVSEADGS